MNKYDIKQTLEDYPLYVLEASRLGNNLKIVSDIDHIVIAGMGHSATPGDIIQAVMKRDPLPVTVVRDYTLPNTVTNRSLVFVLSYSGNTEETICMYSDALKKKAKVVVITSGGKLYYLCKESTAKHIRIPSGLLSRFGILLLLFPVLNILINNNLTTMKKLDIDELTTLLRNPLWKEKAKQITLKIHGKVPLIYATSNLKGIATRWKAMFNENAKMHAFSAVFPEWAHNELQGFAEKGNYHVIMIEDEKDSMRDRKRMTAAKAILKQQGLPITELRVRGSSLLSKSLTALYLGDWISYYLALKNKVDPGAMSLNEDFKKRIE